VEPTWSAASEKSTDADERERTRDVECPRNWVALRKAGKGGKTKKESCMKKRIRDMAISIPGETPQKVSMAEAQYCHQNRRC
jgi:hypothetical protein